MLLLSRVSWHSTATLEVQTVAPEVNLLTDPKFDPNSPDLNNLAALKRSFVQIVVQTNTFSKMDILIKPTTFTDAGEPAIFSFI